MTRAKAIKAVRSVLRRTEGMAEEQRASAVVDFLNMQMEMEAEEPVGGPATEWPLDLGQPAAAPKPKPEPSARMVAPPASPAVTLSEPAVSRGEDAEPRLPDLTPQQTEAIFGPAPGGSPQPDEREAVQPIRVTSVAQSPQGYGLGRPVAPKIYRTLEQLVDYLPRVTPETISLEVKHLRSGKVIPLTLERNVEAQPGMGGMDAVRLSYKHPQLTPDMAASQIFLTTQEDLDIPGAMERVMQQAKDIYRDRTNLPGPRMPATRSLEELAGEGSRYANVNFELQLISRNPSQ